MRLRPFPNEYMSVIGTFFTSSRYRHCVSRCPLAAAISAFLDLYVSSVAPSPPSSICCLPSGPSLYESFCLFLSLIPEDCSISLQGLFLLLFSLHLQPLLAYHLRNHSGHIVCTPSTTLHPALTGLPHASVPSSRCLCPPRRTQRSPLFAFDYGRSRVAKRKMK